MTAPDRRDFSHTTSVGITYYTNNEFLAMAQTRTETLQALSSIHDQRANQPLSILTLAEPLLQIPSSQQDQRHDRASHPLDPLTLSADLAHYRDLFSKLRFSYLEQVSKEKYLRAIVGEPPLIATTADNAALEEKLVGLKSGLQGKKAGSEVVVRELEELARDIAVRYDRVNADVKLLESLPGEIEGLESEVEDLKRRLASYDDGDGAEEVDVDPRMDLSLEETECVLREQQQRNETLQSQISELEREMTVKLTECERAETELEEVEVRRNEITRSVRDMEARTRRGGRDVVEQRGRWLRSEEAVLREMLGLQDRS